MSIRSVWSRRYAYGSRCWDRNSTTSSRPRIGRWWDAKATSMSSVNISIASSR
ncbi:hypothetical protein ACWDZ4_31730 [Streptomyces sp. NPDC003016]